MVLYIPDLKSLMEDFMPGLAKVENLTIGIVKSYLCGKIGLIPL